MIWSLAPFFNELDVLEIRLATLDAVVDKHVIAESTRTHTGLPKPLYFQENRERFAQWQDKIVHVAVEDFPPAESDADDHIWWREREQRRALARGLDGVQPGDTLLLSDCDEIPHPDAVRHVDEPEHLRCEMHVGRLNWRWPGGAEDGYTISRLFPVEALWNLGNLEAVRMQSWGSRPDTAVGWHLSYMANVEEKLAGFAHQEMVRDATPERLLANVESGADPFGRDYRQSEWVGLDELPPYVAEHVERFQHLLVPRPKESGQ